MTLTLNVNSFGPFRTSYLFQDTGAYLPAFSSVIVVSNVFPAKTTLSIKKKIHSIPLLIVKDFLTRSNLNKLELIFFFIFQMDLPWIEKYRPVSLGDVLGHVDVLETLKKLIDSGELPHLLLYGPPGTGKTSTILAVARQLYGPLFKSMVLELNASDERGIDTVRTRIKTFISTQNIFQLSTHPKGRSAALPVAADSSAAAASSAFSPAAAVLSADALAASGGLGCENLSKEQKFASENSVVKEENDKKSDVKKLVKLVILDEADSMTDAAQMALRRLMEKYTFSARFCIIANYIYKLNPAIQSRCTRFRFAPLGNDMVVKRIREIATSEKVIVEDGGLEALAKISGGDMRKVLNILQGAHMAHGKLSELTVCACTGTPTQKQTSDLLALLTDPKIDFKKATEHLQNLVVQQGVAVTEIISQINSCLMMMMIMKKDFINANNLANIFILLGHLERRAANGSSDHILIPAIVATFKRQ